MKLINAYGNKELSELIHKALYDNLEECSFKYHQLMLMTEHDELIGGLEYTIKNDQAIIHNLVIKPEHQRRGYGSLLVQEMINKEFKEIIGQGVFNKGSLKIVNKLGFKRKRKGAFTYYVHE